MSEVEDSSDTPKIRKGDARRNRGNRTGFTTGACSAAAARAATLGLVGGEVPQSGNGGSAQAAVELRVERLGEARGNGALWQHIVLAARVAPNRDVFDRPRMALEDCLHDRHARSVIGH